MGPIIIHGPTTAPYDEELAPMMVHEYHHVNAYEAFHNALTAPVAPQAEMITVNGQGRNNKLGTGSLFQQTLQKNKKYLLRITNSAVDFHFHFSIDNHPLQVVSVDYVPVEPFWVNSISVGIGQRYGVIINTNQTASANGKYWMRTEYFAGSPADSSFCQFDQENFPSSQPDTQRVGIFSYQGAGSGDPKTSRWPETVGCKDPVFKPILKWKVTAPQNDVLKNALYGGLDQSREFHGAFRWTLAETPMWLNYSNPTIANLDNTNWNSELTLQPCKLPFQSVHTKILQN